MADSFTFKGTKTVVNKVGSALRLNPPGGGDTFRFPKWWDLKNKVQYFESAIFRITLDSGLEVKLVIPVNKDNTEVRVRHDGEGNFTFPYFRGVDRVAVVDVSTGALFREYQFPAISKGSILKRTVNDYPSGLTYTSNGSVTGTAEVGEDLAVEGSTYTGGLGTLSINYVLQKSDTGTGGWTTVISSNLPSFTYTVPASVDGKYLRVSTQITDDTGVNSRNSPAIGPITTP